MEKERPMTNEQMNIAIAEHLGWTACDQLDENLVYGIPSGERNYKALLDYCNNLNTMHEVEKMFDGDAFNTEYYRTLIQVCISPMDAVFSTARQRAEAFLKVMNKWVYA